MHKYGLRVFRGRYVRETHCAAAHLGHQSCSWEQQEAPELISDDVPGPILHLELPIAQL